MRGGTKYIHKYIAKGPDQATWEVGDEVKEFLDARYIGTSEAVWRLLHFEIHQHLPTVYRLQVHLPGQHLVHFREGNELDDIIAQHADEQTKLTAWMKVGVLDIYISLQSADHNWI